MPFRQVDYIPSEGGVMRKYVALLSMSMLLVSCLGGDGGTGPSGGGDWFPVAVGNLWNYIVSGEEQESGVLYTLDGNATIEITQTATHDMGFEVYGFERYETIVYLYGGSPVDTTYWSDVGYFRVATDGVYAYGSLSDSTGYQVLKFPLVEGDSWSPGSDDPNGLYEVLSVTSDITVPYGSYSGCAEVRYTSSQFTEYYSTDYWVPGIGLGESLFSFDDSGDSDYYLYTWELSSTNL